MLYQPYKFIWSSGPAITAHGSLVLKQEIHIQIQIQHTILITGALNLVITGKYR
jgi:hypothetical protein